MPGKTRSSLRELFGRSKSSNAEATQRGKQAEACKSATLSVPGLQAPRSDIEPTKNNDSKELLDATATAAQPTIQTTFIEKPDLWLLAYQRAGFDEQQTDVLLGPTHARDTSLSPLHLVEEVKKLAVDRYTDCKRGGWTRNSDNHEAQITRHAETVITAVLGIRDYVSAGLKFDATGCGATAWSIITFSLQVSRVSCFASCVSDSVQLVQNDLVRTQALSDASAYLSDLLARYFIIEQRYEYKDAEDSKRLQNCIVSVYSAILKYALKVKQARESGKTSINTVVDPTCSDFTTDHP
jgi:hypothetical protein